ncbi:MAG: hypothetical protein P1P82_09740 [Bacteroidales bacterium]|nr:hypothetical protein [Bacteroidales bacterium]MDT8431225.1 hypothetical protein [Bacteroidales bacterium]
MKRVSISILILSVISLYCNSQSWSSGTGIIYTNPSTTKVGVGTSYPNTYLHVNGSSSLDPFRVQVNGSTKLWVRSNGGVSIGAYYGSPPDNGLYVAGSVLLKNNSAFLMNSANSGTPRLAIKQGYDNIYMDFMYDLHFRNDHSWTSAMDLQNDGNIAIGVDTKYTAGYDYCNGHKLMVNGDILCEEITVIEDVPSADYVFDSDYRLMDLSDLKKYIKANRHLPGVKSANQFREQGYKLGEMDNALLEKVEELTLYIIDL